jgi:hypothetical protein
METGWINVILQVSPDPGAAVLHVLINAAHPTKRIKNDILTTEGRPRGRRVVLLREIPGASRRGRRTDQHRKTGDLAVLPVSINAANPKKRIKNDVLMTADSPSGSHVVLQEIPEVSHRDRMKNQHRKAADLVVLHVLISGADPTKRIKNDVLTTAGSPSGSRFVLREIPGASRRDRVTSQLWPAMRMARFA